MQVSLSSLKDDTTYGAVYDTLKNNMAAKGMRPSGGVDPQDNTVEDTLTIGQHTKLMKLLLASPSATALRDRSSFAYLYASVGRADDGRMIFLADMMSPREIKCIGEFLCSHNLFAHLLEAEGALAILDQSHQAGHQEELTAVQHQLLSNVGH